MFRFASHYAIGQTEEINIFDLLSSAPCWIRKLCISWKAVWIDDKMIFCRDLDLFLFVYFDLVLVQRV